MPAGSQWEKRIGTVRVNAPGGGTNRSSFISVCSLDDGFHRYCPVAERLKNRGNGCAGMSNLDRTLPPARLCLVTAGWPSWHVQPGRLPLKWSKGDAMDTSLIARPNKPIFGTSGLAVSPADSSEFIDAAAEETCPAETTPMPEVPAADAAREAVSAASLEVMDQLKALAQNVTQGNRASSVQDDASVQSDESEGTGANDPHESQAPEPSITALPRPTGFDNSQSQVINHRPKFRKVLTFAGLAAAALIGAGGTFAWQEHLKSIDVATAAAQAPIPPAPIIAPYLGRQLEELSDDISSVRRDMEALAAKQQQLTDTQKQLDQLAAKQQQLAAKQEQVNQSIAKLHALEQARQKTSAPVQTRAAPVPPRAYVPPPPVEPAVQPPPPPRTASHPIPPASIPPP